MKTSHMCVMVVILIMFVQCEYCCAKNDNDESGDLTSPLADYISQDGTGVNENNAVTSSGVNNTLVIKIKINKSAEINQLSKSKYSNCEQYNVPYLATYNSWANTKIIYTNELDISAINLFPRNIRDRINKFFTSHEINKNDIHLFMNYESLCNAAGSQESLIIRPHYFVAKSEIDKNSNNTSGNIYNSCVNVIVINETGEMKVDGTDDISIHHCQLSNVGKGLGIKASELQSDNARIYYSFVYEPKKKIAAITVHLVVFNEDLAYATGFYESLNIKTNNDFFEFCNTYDKKAYKFMNDNFELVE